MQIFLFLIFFSTVSLAQVSPLNLTGRAAGICPDIIILKPSLQDATNRVDFSSIAEKGSFLVNYEETAKPDSSGQNVAEDYDFRRILSPANYSFVEFENWNETSFDAASRILMRSQDSAKTPFCIIFEHPAMPDSVVQALNYFSKFNVFIIFTSKGNPPFLIWKNVIRPDFSATVFCDFSSIEQTLASIAGLPTPAFAQGVSLLPTLTGGGKQRIPGKREMMRPCPPDSSSLKYAELRIFRNFRFNKWVPEFRNEIPDERSFLQGFPFELNDSLLAPADEPFGLSLIGNLNAESENETWQFSVTNSLNVHLSIQGNVVLDSEPGRNFVRVEPLTVQKGTHSFRLNVLVGKNQSISSLHLNGKPFFKVKNKESQDGVSSY